jgi:hypothetical protein
MSWKAKWREDELLRIGQLLERVLKVPFPETEIRFHIDRSHGLMANLVGYDEDDYRDFFRSVDLARKELDGTASHIALDN